MATVSAARPLAARRPPSEPVDPRRPLVIIALLAVLLALAVAFPARSDRRVPGLRCSLVAADAIGRVAGVPVRLEPSSGTLCRYVPLDAASPLRGIGVVALSAPSRRAPPTADAAGVSRDGVAFLAYANDERGPERARLTAARVAALIERR